MGKHPNEFLESDFNIIKHVGLKPGLYNPRHPIFRSKRLKDIEWERVAKAVNLDVDYIRTRWTFLRSRLTYKLKIIDYDIDNGFFEKNEFNRSMAFLKPFCKRKNRKSKMYYYLKKMHNDEHNEENNSNNSTDIQEETENDTNIVLNKLEIDLIIIAHVKNSPALYDENHSLFCSDVYKEQVWRTLATGLNKDLNDVRDRWLALYDRYVSDLRKINFIPNEKFYDENELYREMQFLNPSLCMKNCQEIENDLDYLIEEYDSPYFKNDDSAAESSRSYNLNNNTCISESIQSPYLKNNVFNVSQGQFEKFVEGGEEDYNSNTESAQMHSNEYPCDLIELDYNLIETIKSYPEIYDHNHKNYRNKKFKQEQWKKIACSLDGNADTLRHRWTSLRERFARYMRSINYSPDDQFYRQNLFCREISYLLPFLRKRKRTSDVKNEIDEKDTEETNSKKPKIDELGVYTEKINMSQYKNTSGLLDIDLKIIEHVKNMPILYDERHAHYNTKKCKEDEWFKLAVHMGLNVHYLRRRWHLLRNRFLYYMRTVNYIPNDKFYEEHEFCRIMRFLEPSCCPKRRTLLEIKAAKTENETANTAQDIFSENGDIENKLDSDFINETQCIEFIVTEESMGTSLTTESEITEECAPFTIIDENVENNNNNEEIKTNNDEENNINDNIENVCENNADRNKEEALISVPIDNETAGCFENPPKQEENADGFFCKSVALYLSQLTKIHKIKAKVEIYKILEKYIDLEENEN